jgi:lipopolysaccharide/colanic/teichoic acid biosynthesis glycosyltransferase
MTLTAPVPMPARITRAEARLEAVAPSHARRGLDVVVAGGALLVLAPLLAVVAVLVKLSGRGPVLYRQTRVGAGGHPFTLYKFRSMTSGAGGPEVTARHDHRVTRIGRWLRRTSLDELPQLLNVLRGDMTLVGPRPETAALAARYPVETRWVFAFRPGLTGLAQLRVRAVDLPDEVDIEEHYLNTLVPRRIALDAEYLSDPSVRRTFAVLRETVRFVLGEPGG